MRTWGFSPLVIEVQERGTGSSIASLCDCTAPANAPQIHVGEKNPRKYVKVGYPNTIILLFPEPAEEWDKREV